MKEMLARGSRFQRGTQYELSDAGGEISGFTYEFVGEGERENVLIHFSPDDALPALKRWKARLTERDGVSAMDKARIWKRGMSALRTSIGTFPLDRVKEVCALSWIVSQNPFFLTREGFTIYDPAIHAERREIAEDGFARYREYVDAAGKGIRKEHRNIAPGYAWATTEDFLGAKKM